MRERKVEGDLKEAQRRDYVLRQMLEKIEAISPSGGTWNDDSLQLARLVAKGTSHLYVPRHADESVVPYAQRVSRLRQTFPMLAILPESEYGRAFEVKTLEVAYAEAEFEIAQERAAYVSKLSRRMMSGFPKGEATLPDTGPTIREALRAYRDWLKSE